MSNNKVKELLTILKTKINYEKNRLKNLKFGKETLVIDDEKIKIYISEKNCKIYLPHDIQQNENKIQKIKETIEVLFDRKLYINFECKGWIVPNGFYFFSDGLYAKKTKKVRGEDVEYICKISMKWLFVIADTFSFKNNTFQYEVMSVTPGKKDEKVELCEKDSILIRHLVVKFLANKLDAPVNDEYRPDLTRFFANFIDVNRNNILYKKTYQTLGWNNDYTQFAPFSKNMFLDFSGDNYNYFKDLVTAFEPKGNKSEFLDRMIIHAANPYADFAISAAFAAPLLKIVGVRSFLLNYNGESKSQKSLSARVGLAAFGDILKLEMSGSDTINVIKAKIHKLQNNLCYIDDIIQKGNKPIINGYDIGNERDRHRLDQHSEIKETKTWRTIAFCSSESPLSKDNDMLGEINRTLELNVDCRPKAYIDDEKAAFLYSNEYYSFLSNNYGLLGEEYINNIIKAGQIKLKNWYNKILKNINNVNNNINIAEHVSSISIICLANYFYRKMFYNIDDINYSINLGKKMLLSIKTKQELDPSMKIIDDIYTFFEVNKNCFLTGENSGNFWSSPNQILGKVKNNEIYFILAPLKAYLEKNGWDWGIRTTLLKKNLIKYKPKSINNVVGKRIILPLNREELEEETAAEEERAAIKEENNIIDFERVIKNE
jgi:uncharacterized protein (DUF927 family)